MGYLFHRLVWGISGVMLGWTVLAAAESLRHESFDRDPAWDGMNNRSTREMRRVEQDFGHANGAIGGTIAPDGTPAYYAAILPEATLDTPLSASGTLVVKPGGGNVLLGFFNAATVNEWRTPNSLVFRINGRGDTFHAHTEFTSAKWRAGAGVFGRFDAAADRVYPIENPSGGVYRWTMTYDPAGNDGNGVLSATLNEQTATMPIAPRLRADGAVFNRFGFLNVVKHADGGGEFFIGDVIVNGERVDPAKEARWDAKGNHASYFSEETRPRFNFGYSATHFAGGANPGEFGGLFFRGDCRQPDTLAYCGAKTATLSLAKPLSASGKLAFRRGVSDSTTLFGFFNATYSVKVTESQQDALPRDFAGFAIEGPSAEGFFAYPTYRTDGTEHCASGYEGFPVIYPDGASHAWEFRYAPPVGNGPGTLTFILDNAAPAVREIPAEHLAEGASFDRFGFVSPWIDGNGQIVYLDDVTYTVEQ